jgi:hypothetical protein
LPGPHVGEAFQADIGLEDEDEEKHFRPESLAYEDVSGWKA